MNDKEIRELLEQYEESYAPWETDGGDCQNYDEGRLVEFAKAIYNKALDAAASNVKIKKEPVTDSVGNIYDYKTDIDTDSILKLKI